MQLSPYHKIFYYEWKLDPNSSKYNIVFDQTLSSNLEIKRLKNAIHRFISNYFILNSHVEQIDDKPSWVISDEIRELEYFNAPYISDQIYNYVSKPFSIESQPLYRFALFTESNGNYRFISVLHHLLIDGNSFATLINEISNYYNFPKYVSPHSLLVQKNILRQSTDLFDSQLKQFGDQYQTFWDNKLRDIEAIDLRWAKPEAPIEKIDEIKFNFTQKITSKLSKLTKNIDITPYQFCQCIFAILLHKYTSKNEITFGYPIAIKGGLPLISGALVNTSLSIYEFKPTTTILDLFKQNKHLIKSIKAIGNNAIHYPINNIINNENKDLLSVMFAQTNLKNTPFNFIDVETLKINSEFNIDLPTKMIFELEEENNILKFRVRYNRLKINDTILSKFVHQYHHMFLKVLNDMGAGITKKISQYSVLSKREYNQIVYTWNKPALAYKPNKAIHTLFEEQAIKNPHNIAIVYENIKLTYSELNNRANQLAHELRTKYSVENEALIALYLDRNEHMIIAILGVLKAGKAYVPIALTNPESRSRHILEDIQAKTIITNNAHLPKVCKISRTKSKKYVTKSIIAIDTPEIQHQLQQQSTKNLNLKIKDSDLVYVMYTSGTVGKPKGVMLEQLGVTIRVLSMIKKSGMNAKSKYLFKTNYVFDVSFSDIFMTLLSGGTLYITKAVFDIEEICNLIKKNKINACHFVPSQLEIINDYLFTRNLFNTLKTINVSGEKFHKSLIHETSHIKYVNYYGPTETGEVTADVTYFKKQQSSHLKLGTLGYPLSQSTLYILDNHLEPVPIGAIGELYIGGPALARAYLNLPELTQIRFISNPFHTIQPNTLSHNTRLYKTGDLVRYLSDGNIEYLGRSDNQVKIRGFRVELSEIENKISNYLGIKHVVVLAQEKTTHLDRLEKYLVAYYVSNTELDESLILDYLAEELPEYMLPNFFIHLANLPLTPNGKLDTKALPHAKITNQPHTYIGPRNALEQKICAIYAEVLKLELHQIGIHDNFFKLGGHSILAIHLTFKLQHHLDITVNDIFEYKTPAQIAQFIPANNFNLVDKLEKIKLLYSQSTLDNHTHLIIKQQQDVYYQKQRSFRFNNKIKPTTEILLTGASGYLGCHLLYELLSTTNHFIHLPIRANSQDEAYKKLLNKFKYYFDMDLTIYHDRITIFLSDLSKEDLGLDKTQYDKLINNVNSVIHSAALVKHYGSYAEFYRENVQATINLLELAKLTTHKDFHYISTIGVFTNTAIADANYNIFTEEPITDSQANLDNIYTKTKYEGEEVTLEYRKHGIKTNIYRVGNLAINSATFKTQENIEDNAFFHRIKAILKLGIMPEELSELEISPVDCTAKAITLLFNQAGLCNQILHVFNPQKTNLYNLFHNKTCHIKLVPASVFIDNVITQLMSGSDPHQIELFSLHQWGLYFNIKSLAQTIIFQDRTIYILNQLKFVWPNITSDMLFDITQKCQNNG